MDETQEFDIWEGAGWIWITYSPNREEWSEKWADNKEKSGKYLFFSDDQDLLIETAKKILKGCNLCEAKVNSEPNPEDSATHKFVLCVYDLGEGEKGGDHRLKVRDFIDFKKVIYRWWKYDNDTRKGNYSDQYVRRSER